MELLINTFIWGTVIGIIHFFIMSILYKNPFVDKIYTEETEASGAVRKWDNIKEYLIKMFIGTQIEISILTFGYLLLKTYFNVVGFQNALIIWGIFSSIRVYPRFWNMWIQSTYPVRLLAIEFINGIFSTGIVVIGLYYLILFFG